MFYIELQAAMGSMLGVEKIVDCECLNDLSCATVLLELEGSMISASHCLLSRFFFSRSI
jgi:hypothetical protein